MGQFEECIKDIARTPVLLVASDYDGTIAPIVVDPNKAKPLREARVALKTLSKLPQTSVSIISGRSLSDLARLLGETENLHLVGSHGSEFDPGFASSLEPEQKKLRDQVIRDLKAIIKRRDGFFIEEKPGSVTLHYRKADTEEAAFVLKEVIEGPGARRGAYLRHGKKVVEISVVATHKGDALEKIRHQVGASAVIFLGDDKTDEDAFSTLKGPDLSVKVGEGESLARFRVSNPKEVAKVLAQITELRCKWLQGAGAEPIENHSLLSDLRTFALSNSKGRIAWYCAPRLDSGAIFSELIGGESAGYWSVEPVEAKSKPRQSYSNNNLILKTKWPHFEVLDYLDCSGGRVSQRAGRSDLIRVLRGNCKVRIKFAPRLDFGRVPTHLKIHKDALEVVDSIDPLVLYAPGIKWKIKQEAMHHTAVAEFQLKKEVALELRYGSGNLKSSMMSEDQRRKQTEQFWHQWAKSLEYPKLTGKHRKLLLRSALTLKALCHGPSGAIAAAATTSLPEHPGGVRNWDYRFCWLRDAAMTAHALLDLGSLNEAMQFLDWVLNIVDKVENPERLRPLYAVSGASVMAEAEIGSLAGYAGSRPVRVGNSAAQQVQLDVFGPIVDLVWALTHHGAPLSSDHWRLVESMVEAVKKRWMEPDHGIWEVRTERKHHTHSKVMCWLTLDRAAKLSERFLNKPRPEWTKLADKIKKEVVKKAWSTKLQSYKSSYESEDLDAATLLIGLSGMISPKEERFKKTVKAIEAKLLKENTVYRYFLDDGLPGSEGGFHLCTCWLIQSYLEVGRKKDALNLFNHYVDQAGPTGLYPEEFHPKTKQGLGNYPQAYSHLGYIQTLLQLKKYIRE